ncbi:MAG: helix-turn-helix domain-containing protein, partial [Longicatena sp.]
MENIGKRLKEKRLELGLTVEDVSSKTRLTQKHIKALEEGNLKFFHDDLSYLRFFVKSYCEAVDIDFEDIKDELRESVNDYTQTISLSTQHDHEEIEKSIANSEKLSKVQSDDAKKAHVRKHAHPHINAKKIKKVDFSLVSLVAVVSVVAIVIIFGFVMYFKSV